MRVVAVATGRTVSVELSVVADRAGLEPATLAELLAPIAGIQVEGGTVVADAELLEAVRWACELGEGQRAAPAVGLTRWRQRRQMGALAG